MNETVTTIMKRRSIREYASRQIGSEELETILRAGQYAPTAMGDQPWHFLVLQNPALLEAFEVECRKVFLISGNAALRELASREGFNMFYYAPTLIIVSGQTTATAPLYDCTLAMENMMLAAASMGIGSCWIHSVMLLHGSEGGRELLAHLGVNFPDGHEPYAAAVFGYPEGEWPEAAPRKEGTVTIVC
jgi:nitroreductase